jgi:hypothetical protein
LTTHTEKPAASLATIVSSWILKSKIQNIGCNRDIYGLDARTEAHSATLHQKNESSAAEDVLAEEYLLLQMNVFFCSM